MRRWLWPNCMASRASAKRAWARSASWASGLKAAIFCDMVGRFYQLGPTAQCQSVAARGSGRGRSAARRSADGPTRGRAQDEKGEPHYAHSVSKRQRYFAGRGGASQRRDFQCGGRGGPERAGHLSGENRSTCLGAKDLYKERVKRLVIVDSGAPQQDVAAMRRVLAEWPTPIFFCGKEVGESLPFPARAMDKDFAWAPAHPVVDAYRAFQAMPYDAPSYDLAAMQYAVHPDSGFFSVSEPGTLTASDDGTMKFMVGGGKVRSLLVNEAKKAEALAAFVALASAKPVAPQQRVRPTNAAAGAGKAADGKPPAITPPVIKK